MNRMGVGTEERERNGGVGGGAVQSVQRAAPRTAGAPPPCVTQAAEGNPLSCRSHPRLSVFSNWARRAAFFLLREVFLLRPLDQPVSSLSRPGVTSAPPTGTACKDWTRERSEEGPHCCALGKTHESSLFGDDRDARAVASCPFFPILHFLRVHGWVCL